MGGGREGGKEGGRGGSVFTTGTSVKQSLFPDAFEIPHDVLFLLLLLLLLLKHSP
jgi:hypothetical protein